MRTRSLLAIFPGAWLAAAMTAGAPETDCERLVNWMTGSFSSARQAAADSSYYNITLHMARIWTTRDDGYWLYVEQAVTENPGKPYRQRIYRVSQVESDLFKSEVFLIPDAEKHVGGWKDKNPLRDVSPDDLELRGGCTVFLRLDARGEFTGGTIGRSCASELRGAAYATSNVVVGPGRIESWDRGFDESGQQMWGAVRGPYVFLRYAGGPSQ